MSVNTKRSTDADAVLTAIDAAENNSNRVPVQEERV